MSKREKITEFFCVKYPEFIKKHKWGTFLAFSVFMLFAMFVASGDFYKFLHSEAFATFMQYFKFFVVPIL